MNQDFVLRIKSRKGIENVYSLYLNPKFSDFSFLIDGEVLRVHKAIVCSSSPYFDTLIRRSDGITLPIHGINVNIFREVLRYVYTGAFEMTLPDFTAFVHVLELSKEYCLPNLHNLIVQHMYNLITFDSVYAMLNIAHMHEIGELIERCCNFLEYKASEILANLDFTKLTQVSMIRLLNRNTFSLPEIKILEMVLKWRAFNKDHSDLVWRCVQFAKLNLGDSQAELTRRVLARVVPDVNLLSRDHKIRYLCNEDKSYPFCPMKHFCPETDCGILLDLGDVYWINYITFQFPWGVEQERKSNVQSYCVSISVDNYYWHTIVNYSKFQCIGRQRHYFLPETAKYIRIVSMNRSDPKCFELGKIRVYFLSQKRIRVINQIPCVPPNSRLNIANARMLAGNYSSKEDVLTQSLSPSDVILIHFGQPLSLSKFTFSLTSASKFSMSISLDYKLWDRIADYRFRTGPIPSHQCIEFEKRPVAYVLIIVFFPDCEDFRIESFRLS